jgi:sugar phosphate isomerase/epimerase
MEKKVKLGFGDLVLCPATLGSPTLEDQARAAVAGGFAGVSVRPWQLLDARDRLGSMGAVKRVVDDSGLRVVDLDALMDWVDDPDYRLPSYLPADLLIPRPQVMDLAVWLDAQSLNVVDISGVERDWGLMSHSFASVCDETARHGMTTYIEFFFGSMMSDLATTARVVDGAARPNGGILLDTFHFHRGPGDSADQLRQYAPRVRMLHLNDAGAVPWADQWAERQHGRLLPGTGSIDLVATLRAVRDGGGGAPVGVEVNNDALHAMDPADAARLAGDAARSVLAQL